LGFWQGWRDGTNFHFLCREAEIRARQRHPTLGVFTTLPV
jgi:hypothetical protein